MRIANYRDKWTPRRAKGKLGEMMLSGVALYKDTMDMLRRKIGLLNDSHTECNFQLRVPLRTAIRCPTSQRSGKSFSEIDPPMCFRGGVMAFSIFNFRFPLIVYSGL